MAGEKRFGTSLFGFKKQDVNSYIQKMLHDFEFRLKEKEQEIAILKNKNKELDENYKACLKKEAERTEDKHKIADALIKAEEKANIIIEEARRQAEEEKSAIEEIVENEREKLVEIKNQIKFLKSEVVNTLKKYEGQLDDMAESEGRKSGKRTG